MNSQAVVAEVEAVVVVALEAVTLVLDQVQVLVILNQIPNQTEPPRIHNLNLNHNPNQNLNPNQNQWPKTTSNNTMIK